MLHVEQLFLMNAELSVQIEGKAARRISLGASYTIGRGRGNDLVLQDEVASRNHALVRLLGTSRYYLADLGSANGTLLNRRPVMVPARLKSGDEIRIANCTLKFARLSTAESESKHSVFDSKSTKLQHVQEMVSVLVVDIRNYTRLAESLPLKQLSRLSGSWFKDAGLIIERHGGIIDKFIGDAVMAYWLRGHSDDRQFVLGPLRAALELVRLARSYHKQLAARYPGLRFAIGCGVHAGKAMLGNVGEIARRDFTAVGDTVIVAFRLESLTKRLGHPILVSQVVKELAGDAFDFETMGSLRLKGKSKNLSVSALSGRATRLD